MQRKYYSLYKITRLTENVLIRIQDIILAVVNQQPLEIEGNNASVNLKKYLKDAEISGNSYDYKLELESIL